MPPLLNQENVLTITETDEVNNPTATYICSPAESIASQPGLQKKTPSEILGPTRIDIIRPSSRPASWSTASVRNYLSDVFLPAGYPHSVSEDYLWYQIFDSLQAFCSSIAGLLSSRAVLQGVGVGNASASPTSALLLHILQDSSGRIATILFAHRVGTALEPECKMYRLAADVFNDIAMVLDCLSPFVPSGGPRVSVLSAAGVLRALCGVAGGSSKASLSAHFAKWGNLAEVNAKDSSQETIISLVGMLVGSLVVSRVTGFAATWTALILLLTTHLGMNYCAVRSVHMTSLNRQRTNIVFSTLIESDSEVVDLIATDTISPNVAQSEKRIGQVNPTEWTLLGPKQAANYERIFEQDGILRWQAATATSTSTALKLGSCRIGTSLSSLLHALSGPSDVHSLRTPFPIQRLLSIFAQESYILLVQPSKQPGHSSATVVLKTSCSAESQIKAWVHALLAARILAKIPSRALRVPGHKQQQQHDSDDGEKDRETEIDMVFRVLKGTLTFLNEGSRFESYTRSLAEVGWDLDIAALETRPGRRVQVG